MAKSSPSIVRHYIFAGCSKTQIDASYADLVLALLSEDEPDEAVSQVTYVLDRVRNLVGPDAAAYRHLAELLNKFGDMYPRA